MGEPWWVRANTGEGGGGKEGANIGSWSGVRWENGWKGRVRGGDESPVVTTGEEGALGEGVERLLRLLKGKGPLTERRLSDVVGEEE